MQSTSGGPLSEAELVRLIEEQGVGTLASLPGTLGRLFRNSYVKRGATPNLLQPTKLGLALINAYTEMGLGEMHSLEARYVTKQEPRASRSALFAG